MLQIHPLTTAEADAFKVPAFDMVKILDATGTFTGEIRWGDGITFGGTSVTGVPGGVSGVTSVNALTGIVVLNMASINDVNGTPTNADWMRYSSSTGGFEFFKPTLDDLVGVNVVGAAPGQLLGFNSAGDIVPVNAPTGTGGFSNPATTALQMAGFGITGVASLTTNDDWSIASNGTGQFFIRQNGDIKAAILTNSTDPTRDVFAVTDYGTGRSDDAATVTPDNMAYFDAAGGLRKTAFSNIALGELGGVDVSGATVGQALVFDASLNLVPGTVAGGGTFSIDGATDTNIAATPAFGSILTYTPNALGTGMPGWQAAQAAFDGTVEDLAVVAAAIAGPGINVNDTFLWDGSAFQIGPIDFKGVGDLSNVDAPQASLQDGDALIFRASSSTFVPEPTVTVDLTSNPAATGAILYRSAAGTWVPLAIGAPGTSLTVNATGDGYIWA